MKRHGNLYPQICDPDNIARAHHNARKGKAHYREVMAVDRRPERYLANIHKMLVDRRFVNSKYSIFVKHGRKDRTISRLPYFPDRIVHHSIVQVMEPLWMRMFIRDTFATIKGRGIHDGVKRMKRFLRDEEGTKYCLKMDVRKFYPSIDHDCLKRVLRGHIKCAPTLHLMDTVIDSATGVPIGNYLSQYFANIYLCGFDHWVKEDLRARYYARYCDDMVVMGPDKTGLHDMHGRITDYLRDRLRLEIKGDWQVFPTRIRGIDFLGYRFFGDRTLVRKRIVQDFRARLRTIKKRWRYMPAPAVVNSVMSYYGWLKHADARMLWASAIDAEIRRIVAAVCAANKIKNPLEGI